MKCDNYVNLCVLKILKTQLDLISTIHISTFGSSLLYYDALHAGRCEVLEGCHLGRRCEKQLTG